jgi:hypothetical protein
MPTTINGNTGVSQVQSGSITQSDLATAILPLGVGQSWVQYSGIRAAATDYVNDTGRPIEVVVSCQSGSFGLTLRMTVGGVHRYGSTCGVGETASVASVIPAGATYRVTDFTGTGTVGTILSWAELR